MASVEPLESLPKGTRLLVGGDRLVRVPDAVAERFRPGDSVLVVDATEEVLLVPAEERRRAREAVDRAREAFAGMNALGDEPIVRFYEAFADRLESGAVWERVARANEEDVADARRRGRSTTRLVAGEKMRQGMIEGLRAWREAPSRRGRVLGTVEHAGWKVELVGAALGVVAFVFEGRPNVLADATGVLRSGNTVVFRIGRDALRTARALMDEALTPALREAGLPEGAVGLVESAEHASGWALFSDRRVALAVARGSGPAVGTLGALAEQAGVPASLHGTGGAWVVATERTEPRALGEAVFASLDRKVCNTLNVLCIPRARAAALVPAALEAFERAGARRGASWKLHVVEGAEGAVPAELFEREIAVRRAGGEVRERQAEPLPESELGREWEWEETPEASLVLVDDLAHAVALFNRHSPQFIASLVSEDEAEHERFWAAVNAPFVGDADTRWVDGQRALGTPELGLSNWQRGRLFARGGILSGDGVYTIRTRARRTR